MPDRSHLAPVAQALLVTFLWSTSWVLIKIGLEDIPALTFAGLRYSLAAVVLLPVVARRPELRSSLRSLSGRSWGRLVLLGLVLYSITQGAQFLAIALLPDVNMVSLLLSFTPAVVALAGIPLLGERPSPLQAWGVGVYLVGAVLYFSPLSVLGVYLAGLTVAAMGTAANAAASLLGRAVNRSGNLHPMVVTVVSMAIGAAVLLATGIVTQGLPPIGLKGWVIIGWLAVVNTAFAFTLWNHTLRRLSAMESSIINNTMLIQIAVLAWIFLGQRLRALDLTGLLLAAAGILLVQLRRRRAPAPALEVTEG